MKVRYCGGDSSRDLAFPGGLLNFERMKWVDVDKACADGGIAAHHVDVVIAGLGDDWEVDTSKPATKKASDS